ncbi:MAG: hypothetical protein SFV19_10770 [Rhodospirillaceae bacterium]|nr:hypothetical protein [Rhodospirillaceae bacterium]
MPVEVWGFIHILLFVFWLGADVGVFVSAVFAKNPKYSFETRMAVVKAGLIVDTFPRICFALILPVGLHLTNAIGVYPVETSVLIGGWIIGIAWVVVIFAIGANQGKPLAEHLSKLQFGFQAVMGLVFTVIGLNSLATDAPLDQTWFAVKILLFGLVYWAAMAIDLCFRPFLAPFMEIGQHGSTPEREEAVTGAINNTLVAVSTLYVLIFLIALIGKIKPF